MFVQPAVGADLTAGVTMAGSLRASRLSARATAIEPASRWLYLGAAAAGLGAVLTFAPTGAVAHADSASADTSAPASRSGAASSQSRTAPAGHKRPPARLRADKPVALKKPEATAEAGALVERPSVGGVSALNTTTSAAALTTAGPVRNVLTDIGAFFGLPVAPPSPDQPTLSGIGLLMRLELEDLFNRQPHPPATDSAAIVTGLFREVLREDPDVNELQHFTDLLDRTSVNVVVATLYSSTAFRHQEVNGYYLEILGRAPTQSELAQRAFELSIGIPEPLVVASITASDEFYGASGGTPTAFVQNLYRNLVGEPADPALLPVFVQQLQAGLPRELVALQFVTGNDFRAAKIQETYQVVLGRQATIEEVESEVGNWIFDGGLAGIGTDHLASSANITRMIEVGVLLPDMVAVNQLQQILTAPYTENSTGFVRLFDTYLKTGPSGEKCETSCNTALLNLIRTGGSARGIPNQSIQVTPVSATVSGLLPTQNEIDLEKTLKNALTDADTVKSYLAGGTILASSVILTADGGTYIVDGHHRWSGVYVINPYAQISSIDLGYVPSPQEALKETQTAIVAEVGYLPTETVQGVNLFTVDKTTFDAAVVTAINSGKKPEDVMKVFKKERGLDSMAAVQDYLWANVLRMRQFNEPVPGATGRGYMPQTPNGDLTTLMHLMENGNLSYSVPVIAFLG